MQIPNQRVCINLYVHLLNVDFFYCQFRTNVKNASKSFKSLGLVRAPFKN